MVLPTLNFSPPIRPTHGERGCRGSDRSTTPRSENKATQPEREDGNGRDVQRCQPQPQFKIRGGDCYPRRWRPLRTRLPISTTVKMSRGTRRSFFGRPWVRTPRRNASDSDSRRRRDIQTRDRPDRKGGTNGTTTIASAFIRIPNSVWLMTACPLEPERNLR